MSGNCAGHAELGESRGMNTARRQTVPERRAVLRLEIGTGKNKRKKKLERLGSLKTRLVVVPGSRYPTTHGYIIQENHGKGNKKRKCWDAGMPPLETKQPTRTKLNPWNPKTYSIHSCTGINSNTRHTRLLAHSLPGTRSHTHAQRSTREIPSPTTTVARKRKRRPPLTTRVTRSSAMIFSSNSFTSVVGLLGLIAKISILFRGPFQPTL